jgi:hypothetical protein
MPRNETVLTPTPTSENFGSKVLAGILRVVGNSIEVAGSATMVSAAKGMDWHEGHTLETSRVGYNLSVKMKGLPKCYGCRDKKEEWSEM